MEGVSSVIWQLPQLPAVKQPDRTNGNWLTA